MLFLTRIIQIIGWTSVFLKDGKSFAANFIRRDKKKEVMTQLLWKKTGPKTLQLEV